MQQINNPLQFMQAVQSGQNPQQLIMQLLQQRLGNTPMGKNLLQFAQQGDGQSIETFARNFCASRGLDFDKEFTQFKKTLGM